MSAYLGIGASSSATAADIAALAGEVLDAGGMGWSSVTAVATTERLAGDARLAALGVPVVGFPAGSLAAVEGTQRSARAAVAAGTPSVAEAAALLAAGPGARLLVAKRRAARVPGALAGA